MIRVLIADDEEIIRRGIARLLSSDPELLVVAEAEDGEQALALTAEQHPNLLFVDLNMPFLNGFQFIEKAKELDENMVVIVVTGYDQFTHVKRALQLGVFDYLLKPIMESSFYETIEKAKRWIAENEKRNQYVHYAKIQIQTTEEMRYSPLIQKVRAWIESEYSDPEISLQIAADKFHVSLQHLSRTFKQETGISFIEYLTQIRMAHAIQFLIQDSLKIYEIAQKTGYSTQHYFSNVFKKTFGMTPLDYRQQMTKDDK